MYISYQGQQTIHQEIVADALRRSGQRRALKELKQQREPRERTWNVRAAVAVLVHSIRVAAVRP